MIRQILKILMILFFGALLLFWGFIVFYKIQFDHYVNKYEKTELSSSVETVKDNWGEPDDILIRQDDTLLILLYNKRAMTDYVFKFDRQSKKLIEKWEGD
ncbi:MAG: hypothetical protein DI539_22030 [Flavobacterium psychrophilum]|nr:MAG: hypothetical protein DI539_22030 [Flavobacterium psychrophilum]